MSDTVQTATTEPVQVAQTSVEKKGAVSESDFARRLAGKQVPYTFQSPPPVEVAKATETPAQVTEEAKKAPESEAQPEETKTEEAKAETAEATEEETSEVLSPEATSLDPKLQAKIDRRIGKEVGKTKKAIERAAAAEARLAELEARLAAAPTEVEKEVPVSVPSNVPLAEYDTPEKLNVYKEALANDIIEAEGLLYADFPAEGMETKWGKVTKPQLIGMLTEAKKTERTLIPAREKFLTTKSQSAQTAQEKFPFLKDPKHPGYQMAKQALKDNPVLNAYPNRDFLVGMLVKGQLALQAEEAAAKAEVKPLGKPKPRPTGGQSEITSDASVTRAPVGLGQGALEAEITKIKGGKKSLDSKDFAAILAAKSRFRNSQ